MPNESDGQRVAPAQQPQQCQQPQQPQQTPPVPIDPATTSTQRLVRESGNPDNAGPTRY